MQKSGIKWVPTTTHYSMSQVLAIVDTVFLITSIFMLILSTIPQFQELKVTLIKGFTLRVCISTFYTQLLKLNF